MELVHCRARRRFSRGLKRKPVNLMRRLRKAKKEAAPMEKPDVVKTHLRNMIVLPEMIGSMVGVYNGKTFNQVEIKVGIKNYSLICSSTYVCNNKTVSAETNESYSHYQGYRLNTITGIPVVYSVVLK